MDQISALPFTPTSFQRLLNEHKLAGSRCLSCGSLHLPPRPICSNCRSTLLE
jgi:uncharacterized OB-fold protein